MATIRRIPSIEHNFQLVITRVYEDGDQELLEDEEESAFFSCLSIPRLSLFHKPTKNAYSS
jgi:VID27-like protein